MAALVSVETVLLVLLAVLVAGLLRSHAEILRRLGPGDGAGGRVEPPGVVAAGPSSRPRGSEPAAPALAGITPRGDAVHLDFLGAGAPTLLAFLSTGCAGCAPFWRELGVPRLPHDVRTVIVTRGPERERASGVRRLAPASAPVVMSTRAWEEYDVPGSPYFVLVDGGIRGEGAASSWSALASLIADAIEDEQEPRAPTGVRRARDIDTVLAAGGIAPGHPSLYPSGPQGPPTEERP